MCSRACSSHQKLINTCGMMLWDDASTMTCTSHPWQTKIGAPCNPVPHKASSDILSDAIKSSASSIPHEMRTNPSVIPTFSRSSCSMFACVITCTKNTRAQHIVWWHARPTARVPKGTCKCSQRRPNSHRGSKVVGLSSSVSDQTQFPL